MNHINLTALLVCLIIFLLLTYAPYILGKKMTNRGKFLARNWLAVVFPSVLIFYMIMVDGMDLIGAKITEYAIIWAIAQGVIFALTDAAQKITFKKGDWHIEADMRDDKSTAKSTQESTKKD